jgi:hypothetical protein
MSRKSAGLQIIFKSVEKEGVQVLTGLRRRCSVAASSTKVSMFFAHRPQQPASFKPNLALIWHGITQPARPALRTSESVIPLHKHRYMSASLFKNDYEKHSQYAMCNSFCQQEVNTCLVNGL